MNLPQNLAIAHSARAIDSPPCGAQRPGRHRVTFNDNLPKYQGAAGWCRPSKILPKYQGAAVHTTRAGTCEHSVSVLLAGGCEAPTFELK